MKLQCSRCGKRLSRKFARLIDGKVLCSSCMFATEQPSIEDERTKEGVNG